MRAFGDHAVPSSVTSKWLICVESTMLFGDRSPGRMIPRKSHGLGLIGGAYLALGFE